MTTTVQLPDLLAWEDAEDIHEYLLNRVKRGVVALDVTDPPWRTKIVVLALDMSSTCDCVIGQLDVDWEPADRNADHRIGDELHAISGEDDDTNLSGYFPVSLGFDFDKTLYDDETQGLGAYAQYALLADLWRDAILQVNDFEVTA